MVTMTYPSDQLKYKSCGGSGSSKKTREAALESAECRRHGFILTDKILGTGAYAKVRLARVGERKLERCAKLKEDLKEKGHDMVSKENQLMTIEEKKHYEKVFCVAGRTLFFN